MTRDEYYEKLGPIADDLYRSEAVVCGSLKTHPSKRDAKRKFLQYRNRNERRLQREMLEKAQSVEGVSGPILTGVLTWLAGLLLTPLFDAAKRALWNAVKDRVKEILDKLQADLFPEGV